MNSCVFRGTIRHRRFTPKRRDFQYRLFMLYLDLDELPDVFNRRWLWSARRIAPAWFRRADYLGDPSIPLADAVRTLVAERTGQRPPTGPIRLLTHLRYWGYVQNPVSFYYCFDATGALQTIVTEITNTPWGERHAYVVRANPLREMHESRFDKTFHVSPFLPMDQHYTWRFTTPGDRLHVHMANWRDGVRVFDATLHLRRASMTGPVLAGCLVRHPWMTASVAAGIYWQALRLWLRGVPFHAHPVDHTSDVTPVINR